MERHEDFEKIEQMIGDYPMGVRGMKTKLSHDLHENYPYRSHKGWEKLLYNYLKYVDGAIQQETSPIEYDKTPYHYNKETDTYITFIKCAGENLVISGDMHRAMKSSYSNMTSKGATLNQIAREFNFPRLWFDEYRRKHGWTHDMLPYTDEEVMETDNDELVEDLVL